MALNDRELATYQYDNLGQRISQSRYTQSDFVTFTYNNDGTIASYKDALNRRTEARNWKRGAPQTIIQAVGTADEITTTSVFDNNGWLSSKTDANGNRTSYSHDIMGRMTKITPPSGWASTDIDYVFPNDGGAIPVSYTHLTLPTKA